jgi:ribonuclease P/MRP protein subunit RPP40
MDMGLPVDVIYLDFAKAFDSVPHKRLLIKLQGYGIQDDVCGWIRHFLVGRRQRVQIGGTMSDWAPVTSGIPQGSVLGPILFVIFINDMLGVIKSFLELFADDSKIFRALRNIDDRALLQDDLDNVDDWSVIWQLRFNAGKCKVLHIGSSNPQYTYTMTKNKVVLETTDLEKDLGVNIDAQLKFSKHVEMQVNKSNRILGLIRRSYEYLDAESVKLLFCALIRPHLEFCNVAWSPRLIKDKTIIERVLRRATKMVSEVKELPYEERLARLRIPSMSYRRARGDMIEAYKYLHGLYSASHNPLVLDESSITRGHSLKLKKRFCKTSTRQHFFSYRVVDSWNNLPSSVVEAPTLNCFKGRLDRVWSEYMYRSDVNFPLAPNRNIKVDTSVMYKPDQLIGSQA